METPHGNECADDALNQIPLEERLHEIPYLHCDVHTQFRYQLVNVCVKRECPDFCTLACAKCERDHAQKVPHSVGDFVQLPDLVAKVVARTKCAPQNAHYDAKLKPLIAKAEALSQQIFRLSDRLRQVAQSLVVKVRAMAGVEDDYTALQQREQLEALVLQGTVLKLNSRPQINEYLHKLATLVTVRNAATDAFDVQYSSADKEAVRSNQLITLKERELCARLEKAESELKAAAINVQEIENIDFNNNVQVPQVTVVAPKFAPQSAHANIAIENDNNSARCAKAVQGVVAVTSHDLRQSQDDQRWAVRVHQKSNLSIGIGVGLEKVLQQKHFLRQAGLGCGLYTLCSNGALDCHAPQQQQQAQNNGGVPNFMFDAGDVVYAEYSPQMKRLLLCKNKQKPYVLIKIPDDEHEKLCPVVQLHKGSQVEIVQALEYDFEFDEQQE